MIQIDPKPVATVFTHEGTIILDKEYKFAVDKIVTPEGTSYTVQSFLEGDEKRIVEGAIINELNKNGIK